jgi:hypothetical protein
MEADTTRDLGRLSLPAGRRSLRCCIKSMEEHDLGSLSDRHSPREQHYPIAPPVPRSCQRRKTLNQ